MKIESSRQTWTEWTNGRRLWLLELLTEPKTNVLILFSFIKKSMTAVGHQPIRHKTSLGMNWEWCTLGQNNRCRPKRSCFWIVQRIIAHYFMTEVRHLVRFFTVPKSLKSSSSLIVHCCLAFSRSLDINGSLPSVYLESNTEMSRARHHNNRKCMNKTIIINMYLDIPSLHKQPSPSQHTEMILW